MKKSAKVIAIAHRVFAHEDFDYTAHILLRLLRDAQSKFPGAPRSLHLEIDGHRNSEGGFDDDMLELQSKFMTEVLMEFLTSAQTPLATLENKKPQNDDIPEEMNILKVDPPPSEGPEEAQKPRF